MDHLRQAFGRHWLMRLAGLVLVLVLAGCLGRPRPPALQQGKAVYRNTTEGFRLAPPPGWYQQGRGEPSGNDRVRECQLVKYKRLSEAKDAFFWVWVVEAPAGTDLADYLANRPADRNCKRVGNVETLEVDQVRAVRQVLADTFGKDKMLKEIVAVQRSTRIYLFVGVFPIGDEAGRKQIREAVASVVWESEPKS
jgi:hypothetical protein